MARIEEMTDADIAEIHRSSEAFAGVVADTEPLKRFLDFHHSLRWRNRGRITRGSEDAEAEDALLDGGFGDPFPIIAGYVDLPEEGETRAQEELFERAAEQLALMGRKRKTATVSLATLRPLLEETRALASEERFFHWEVAFPGVWENWESSEPEGGFDAVIGNPPWDRIKMQEVEWFAARDPDIAHAQRAADRKRMIRALESGNAPLWRDYLVASGRAEAGNRVARTSGQYPLLATGDINIYALFVERAHRLIKPDGIVGLLVPSGIASDKSASAFFGSVATDGRLAALLDFENKRVFFPEVDSRFKFCVFVTGGRERRFGAAQCAFFLHDTAEANDPDRVFALTAEDFAAVNPNTGTAPVFRTARDATITSDIYGRVPVLVDRRTAPPGRVWPVDYVRMFDMTNDSAFFRTRAELEADGAYPVGGNRLKKGEEEFVPLIVGRMINQFDHRAASVEVNPENLHNPAVSAATTLSQHQDPAFATDPQFWVTGNQLDAPPGLSWFIGFRDIARVTDVRTVIAAIVPKSAAGNTLPLILPDLPNPPPPGASKDTIRAWREVVSARVQSYKRWAVLLTANLNTLVLDFVARQKVQSTHLNWYIVEQLPVLPEDSYARRFGERDAASIVREEVLKLTYTAHDMEPFARDMGYEGEPFVWDEEERRHSRARLDALFFLLYGIADRDDVGYILDTFPIVRQQDEKEFGRYLTRDLILAYLNAFEAGDTDSRIDIR